jgi:hypothetical protein
MPTITGTLETILNMQPNLGSIEVALCGYGSQVPRINARALGARITDDQVSVNSDGTFQFHVVGNDEIVPAGTFYTITVKDENGDIAQVNAYRFFSAIPDYDLNLIDSYDPTQPPPPIPPVITDMLLIVPFGTTPEFPGDVYTSWQITLEGDAWPSFTNILNGNLYTIIVIQDSNGEHSFHWPANVFNMTAVNPEPDGMTIQTFVAMESGLHPIGAATYYP